MREPSLFEAPLCAQVDPELFFPEQHEGNTRTYEAKSVCANCIHKAECLEWALVNEGFGIWGGTTEMQRRQIRKRMRITRSA
jgi:WhiB family redox-sensing transcriptional regulator